MVTRVTKGALDSIPPIFINGLVAIIAALITLAGQKVVSEESADADKYIAALQASQEENKLLRESLRSAQLELRKAREDIFDLKALVAKKDIELGQKWEQHTELKAIMDSSPLVMWFNRVEVTENGDIRFPMYHINPRYTYTHGVSLAKYRGKTAEEIWPEDVAEGFRQNNLRVLENKDGFCTFEHYPKRTFLPVSEDNPIERHRVCKWLIPFENGFGLFGMASDAL